MTLFGVRRSRRRLLSFADSANRQGTYARGRRVTGFQKKAASGHRTLKGGRPDAAPGAYFSFARCWRRNAIRWWKSSSLIVSLKLAGIGDNSDVRRSSTSAFGDAHLLAQVVGHDDQLPLLPQHQPGQRLAVLQVQHGRPQGLVHVPRRVEDVFEQPVQPADADAVELRADLGPLAAELVAVGAVVLEHQRPGLRVGLRLPEGASAAG